MNSSSKNAKINMAICYNLVKKRDMKRTISELIEEKAIKVDHGFDGPCQKLKRHTTMNTIANHLFCFLLVIFYSCNNSGTNSKTTLNEKIKVDNQGVNIDYYDSKTGDAILLFIHGWGSDQTYWANQVTPFVNKYRVVTLDLPGFGKSGRNRKSWTVEDYGKDVSVVLNKLDLRNVIIIGHSMSGAIAVETALTNPSRIIGVIGVDNFKDIGIVLTPKIEEEWRNFYRTARQNFKKTVSENMLQYLFSPSTDIIIRKRVSNDILNADTIMAVDCLENADKYPFVEKLKSLKKTLYLINSDFMPTDTLAFQRNKIDYDLFNIGTTGHYPMLEKPGDFNLLMQQAIDKIESKETK